jgi:hypothetical protein
MARPDTVKTLTDLHFIGLGGTDEVGPVVTCICSGKATC